MDHNNMSTGDIIGSLYKKKTEHLLQLVFIWISEQSIPGDALYILRMFCF